jgi:cell division protein FtsZ
MVSNGVEGVETISANTDSQALLKNKATEKIILGELNNHGQGAGGKPDVGRDTALDDYERLTTMFEGANMVFIAAGMGGGTGTGAAPIVARAAKEVGALAVAIVTKPMSLEFKDDLADAGIKELRSEVDSLITIPNQKLSEVFGGDCTMLEAFGHANDILLGAVRGIADIITQTGYINVDFNDVKTVMAEQGVAMMGTGIASGPSRAKDAAAEAVGSPLLEDISLQNAKGVLVNITGKGIKMGEIEDVLRQVKDFASDGAQIIHGAVEDGDMEGDIKVTIIATGLSDSSQQGERASSFKVANDPYGKFQEVPTLGPRIDSQNSNSENTKKNDYLDIPSFVRKQID